MRIHLARILAGVILLTGLTVAQPAAADPPDCYTHDRLPGECLSLATFTYIAGLENFRDHLISQVLRERADRQAAQLQTNALRDELWATYEDLARANQRASVLQSKVRWQRVVIRRLWHTIARLR